MMARKPITLDALDPTTIKRRKPITLPDFQPKPAARDTLTADSPREALEREYRRRIDAQEIAELEVGTGKDGAVVKADLVRALGL